MSARRATIRMLSVAPYEEEIDDGTER